jgi:hypothetical protein
MAIDEFGTLAKLKIVPIEGGEPFVAMFNPTSYSQQYSIEYKKRGTANSKDENYDFVKSNPQDFKLKIIIDGTGVSDFIVGPPVKSVSSQVKDFLKLAYALKKDSKTNKSSPNPLKISWGTALDFYCRLKSVNITYTLFDRLGNPLRADLDASFVGLPDKNSAGVSGAPGGGSSGGGSGGQNGIVISVS